MGICFNTVIVASPDKHYSISAGKGRCKYNNNVLAVWQVLAERFELKINTVYDLHANYSIIFNFHILSLLDRQNIIHLLLLFGPSFYLCRFGETIFFESRLL